ELSECSKNVATEEVDKIKSLSLQEVTGEIIDIELNSQALSLFIIEEGHVFERNKIARGHFIFAQANSLCVAVINEPLALTKSADIEIKRQAKLHDKVISKAIVNDRNNNNESSTVKTKWDGR